MTINAALTIFGFYLICFFNEANTNLTNTFPQYMEQTTTALPSNFEQLFDNSNLISTLQIKNIKIKPIGDEYFLNWEYESDIYEDNFEITAELNVTNNKESLVYFRQIRTVNNLTVTNKLIGKFQKCSSYEVTLQAHNKYSETEKYQFSFDTKPYDIGQLSGKIKNDSTLIFWSGAKDSVPNEACSNFEIKTVHRKFGIQIANRTWTNYYASENSQYCTEFSIKPFSLNGQISGKTSIYREVPGIIRNVRLKSNETSITVSWEPPEDDSCVTGYRLKFNIIKEILLTAAERTSYTFSKLESCAQYGISVSALAKNNIGETTSIVVNTTIPEVLGAVTNLQLKQNDNGIFISWNAPYHQSQCIQSYYIKVDKDEIEINKNTTFYEYANKLIGCKTYNIKVYAYGDVVGKTVENKLTVEEKEHNSPIIEVTQINATAVTFLAKSDSSEESECELTSIRVSCTALAMENEEMARVVVNKTREYNFKQRKKRVYDLVYLDGLSPFTNYTCHAFLKTDTLKSPYSKQVKFITELSVPSKVDLSNTDINSRNFTIEWTEAEPAAKLETYEIAIEPIKSLHDIPKDCSVHVRGFMDRTDRTSYIVKNVFPHYEYQVRVTAENEEGLGESAEITVQTIEDVSEPVRELQQLPSQENKYDTVIYWKYPCNTNGIVDRFIMTTISKSIETGDTYTEEQKVEFLEDGLPYEIPLKLLPYHSYRIEVYIQGEQFDGEVDDVSFESPPGSSSVPKNINFKHTSASSFEIEWETPDIQNGIIIGYIVDITDEGQNFELPDHCEVDLVETNFVEEVKELNYTFYKALPYHNYKVMVAAKTIEIGEWAIEQTLTLDSDPEIITSFNITLENYESSDDYNVTIIGEFLPSCNIAGIFKDYKIIINGIRPNFESHGEILNIKDTTFEFNLLPEYEYKVQVSVRNENYESESEDKIFSSPAGVPIIKSPNISEPGRDYSVVLSKLLFGNENGDIHYYAVLLSVQYIFRANYGYWDEQKWPEVGRYSTEGSIVEPYQITEERWQPFNPEQDDKISLILGNVDCKEGEPLCNGPLRRETTYTLTFRGFTKRGFRDIRIYFTTPKEEEIVKLGVILGIVFGVFSMLVILGFSFFMYKKRLIANNNKVISNNIVPLQENNEISPKPTPTLELPIVNSVHNEDFSTMVLESGKKNPICCTIGESPENRKRNRYLNILPYDWTRVKLKDHPVTDYINASYIKGYSSEIEYIATQGPLENTVPDFWNMVAQEKVTIVLMLTQLVEVNREKCYKYFPYINESVDYVDMNVVCTEQTIHEAYVKRKLTLNINDDKCLVYHFQYTDWPDFNVPDGTVNMLNFVQSIRELQEQIGGVILVHCSAGVGRTGTLISIDILLQAIKLGTKYNIFTTVLDLRRQRTQMVQNEKQYNYIGTCIKDYIKKKKSRNSKVSIDQNEPIYENVEVTKNL